MNFVIITGASKGIGQYLFEEFKFLGYDVIGTYYSSSLNAEGLSMVDVSDFSQVTNWINNKMQLVKDVVLINCAGINYNCFTHKSEPEEWKRVIEVNLLGTYNCIRALLPIMREQKYGRIINFSSVLADKGTPGVSAYSASKAALSGLAKSIASENSMFNITINNINLGYCSLGMIDQVPEKYLQNILMQIPSQKLCQPEDIFLTVKYLIECGYTNGTSINVNGAIL